MVETTKDVIRAYKNGLVWLPPSHRLNPVAIFWLLATLQQVGWGLVGGCHPARCTGRNHDL